MIFIYFPKFSQPAFFNFTCSDHREFVNTHILEVAEGLYETQMVTYLSIKPTVDTVVQKLTTNISEILLTNYIMANVLPWSCFKLLNKIIVISGFT